jgi:hypothetical protein
VCESILKHRSPRSVAFACLLACGFGLATGAGALETKTLTPETAQRGSILTITGSGLSDAKLVRLCPADSDGCDNFQKVDVREQSSDVLKVLILKDTPVGRYRLEVSDGTKASQAGNLAVTAVVIQAKTLAPPQAERGAMVTLTGAALTGAAVKLCPAKETACVSGIVPNIVERSAETLKFPVPYAPLGEYRVEVTDPAAAPADHGGGGAAPAAGGAATAHPATSTSYPGNLTIIPPTVEVTSVVPTVPFPGILKDVDRRANFFELTVTGKGFSEAPHSRENVLLLSGMPALLACSDPKPVDESCAFRVETRNGGRELHVSGIPYKYHGFHKLQVQVGPTRVPANVEDGKPVTLSQVGKTVPLVAAMVLLGGLGFAVYGVMRNRTSMTPAGKISMLSSWFLDEESNTYSLSKFQLYAWTFAAVFGYLYLSAARSLVQGSLELSPIPDGLPTLLATAAGTSVLATSIGNFKGSKGSNDFRPSLADFFTHGGIVAPERFQFFIWTIIGAVSFLGLTLLHSPAEIQDLPRIPDQFLTLAGISAAGYLGGKLARPAGLKITGIALDTDPATKDTLLVSGSLLAKSATITITDLATGKAAGTVPSAAITIAVPEDPSAGADLAKVLRIDPAKMSPPLVLPTPDPARKQYRIAVLNPDGTHAEWEY